MDIACLLVFTLKTFTWKERGKIVMDPSRSVILQYKKELFTNVYHAYIR